MYIIYHINGFSEYEDIDDHISSYIYISLSLSLYPSIYIYICVYTVMIFMFLGFLSERLHPSPHLMPLAGCRDSQDGVHGGGFDDQIAETLKTVFFFVIQVIQVSIDWFKGKITGTSHISWENLWFPVDFPFN